MPDGKVGLRVSIIGALACVSVTAHGMHDSADKTKSRSEALQTMMLV